MWRAVLDDFEKEVHKYWKIVRDEDVSVEAIAEMTKELEVKERVMMERKREIEGSE